MFKTTQGRSSETFEGDEMEYMDPDDMKKQIPGRRRSGCQILRGSHVVSRLSEYIARCRCVYGDTVDAKA